MSELREERAHSRERELIVSLVGMLCLSIAVLTFPDNTARSQVRPLVPLVPSPTEVVEEILRVARPRQGMTIADLGCGDGRIAIAAARRAARAICIENDPEVMDRARRGAEAAGVAHLISFLQIDLRDFARDVASVGQVDAVVLYLSSELNEEISNDLQRNLKPTAMVISHAYPIRTWKPREIRPVWISSTRNTSRIYVYQLGLR